MLAIEQDDEWLVGRRYLSAHSIALLNRADVNGFKWLAAPE
jgi:hypothetical protein